MKRSRTANSIRNIKYALIGQMMATVCSFVSRTVFVHVLGKEYLGVAGLFGNILSILALAELGIGAAINYSLYKPLAENDQDRIKVLMALYRKTYTAIGLFILVAGCALTPRLDLFVKEMPSIPHFQLIYVLYVINNASAYFFSYKGALINADQKQFVTTTITHGSSLLMHIMQIIILLVTKNYLLYLFVMLACTYVRNISISVTADKLYPYIREKTSATLDKQEKDVITKNIKAMIMHKVGGIVVDSTDNILLSKIVSVGMVGLYSNYHLITYTLMTIYNMLFNAVVSSVGNLGASESKEKIYANFRFIDFVGTWLYSFSFVCLVNLFNPFIRIWVGEEYLFNWPMVLVISLNFYLTGMRNSVLTFRSALGLYWYDRYKALGEAIINLIVSIVLGIKLGAIGIFIGTATSTITMCLTMEPYITYKYGFAKPVMEYYTTYFKRLLLTAGMTAVVALIGSFLPQQAFINLFGKAILCMIIPNTVLWLISHKKEEYGKAVGIIKKKVLRKA